MNDTINNIISGIPVFLIVLLVLAVIALYIWSFFWLYNDAQLREKSGCLVVIVLLFFVPWPWGLLIWLVCRPNIRYYYYSNERNAKPVAEIVKMKKCPKCNMENSIHRAKCLYCGAELYQKT